MPTANLSVDSTESISGSVNSPATLTGSIGTAASLGTDIVYNTLKPIVDNELSSTSTNAVMNKVIYAALQAYAAQIPSVSLGTVESVDYDEDLSITNTGVSPDVILNFKIPKGKDGNILTVGDNGH